MPKKDTHPPKSVIVVVKCVRRVETDIKAADCKFWEEL